MSFPVIKISSQFGLNEKKTKQSIVGIVNEALYFFLICAGCLLIQIGKNILLGFW